LASLVAVAAWPQPTPRPESRSILDYIRETWSVLTRSNRDLATAARDPKFPPPGEGRWPVFVSRTADLKQIEATLRREMQPVDYGRIELRPLPPDPAAAPPGLLYLPRPYIVPGGRFNEMYGWDSFFIQMSLLRDGQIALAKDMADNFLYEIRQYGKILNANRTYYLTRSQPPFLTQMLLAVYGHTHDREWLAGAVPAVEATYRYWTGDPHLTAKTQLSRYFDRGEGPAPEVLAGERDAQGETHYDLVRQYFRSHRISSYDVSQYYNRDTNQLTALFYKGDRSMRESGFDPSNRFGPFSIDVIHYNPVCLNTLLFLMESQAAELMEILARPADAQTRRKRAEDRKARINRLMWDGRDGLYYDYNFIGGHVRRYPFLTTFYPLWAGIATPAQAARIARSLPRFESPGGLRTSTYESGNQWDSPFGWAPLEWIAVHGLRRYGYKAEAQRISVEFLSLVLDQYRRHGIIAEKYDVVHRDTAIGNEIRYGYRSNEVGFGWTNAVFTALLDDLPPAVQSVLLNPNSSTH
jgi:alpha,alpha-trehalase